MIKKKIYIWASDYSNFTGEGNLGRLYVNLRLKKKYKIVLSKFKSKNYFGRKILGHKYILPFLGILNCWKYFILRKKVCYLNYLPLRNCLIFLLLPPKTILGPITGGSYYKDEFSINYFIRKFIFPIFYILSSFILYLRNFNTTFSTMLLKKYLTKYVQKKSEFNFVLNALKLKKIKEKKNLQILIYYKKHKNKINLYPIKLIKTLINLKLKILIIGDHLNIDGVKNIGYVNRSKLNKLLISSKYAILSSENLLSFFAIECINSKVKLITTNRLNKIDKSIRNKYLYINPKKITNLKIRYF